MIIALVAAAAAFVAIALLVGTVILVAKFAPEAEPLSPAERAIVLDAEQLAGWMDYAPDPEFETSYKQRLWDGSFEIGYEYQEPDDQSELFVMFNASFEPNVGDSRLSYGAYRAGMTVGTRIAGGAELQEREDLFSWGDESVFGLLLVDGRPAGNYFVGRKGALAVVCMFSGIYFDEAESIAALLEPPLQRTEEFARSGSR